MNPKDSFSLKLLATFLIFVPASRNTRWFTQFTRWFQQNTRRFIKFTRRFQQNTR